MVRNLTDRLSPLLSNITILILLVLCQKAVILSVPYWDAIELELKFQIIRLYLSSVFCT